MKFPEGYPIQTVTEPDYVSGLDACLERDDLVPGEQYTLRLITERQSPYDSATDYPIMLDDVISYRVHTDNYVRDMAVFRPMSADGDVLPRVRRERILQSGLLYKTLRLVMFNDLMKSHDGYFVGGDSFESELGELLEAHTVDLTVVNNSKLNTVV